MAFEIVSVEGSESKIWTWSATPPTANAEVLFARAVPPKYGHSRVWISGVSRGRRSFVLQTQ
jgi:hypothetical protein